MSDFNNLNVSRHKKFTKIHEIWQNRQILLYLDIQITSNSKSKNTNKTHCVSSYNHKTVWTSWTNTPETDTTHCIFHSGCINSTHRHYSCNTTNNYNKPAVIRGNNLKQIISKPNLPCLLYWWKSGDDPPSVTARPWDWNKNRRHMGDCWTALPSHRKPGSDT